MSEQRCVQCGTPLPDESHFCPKCGASLGGSLPIDPSSGPRGLWEVLLHRLGQAVAPRYEIERLLGFGGMAGVYLAQDTRLGRSVAIKVMSPSLMSDPKQVERFRQEARATAKLSHPNIVTIHEIDESQGLQYLVMAYIDGRTLGGVLSEGDGPVALERGTRWIGQIARALDHAHGFGIVHRDIKPGNILIDGTDAALVTDFGIAKVTDEPGLTRTGMMVGTPTYMSPEQCRAGEVGGASDQYALAILAHHVLAGSPPFTGGTMTVLHQHVSETPPPLAERCDDCPAHVAQAVDRALAKDPADRWPSMEAFLAALENRESRPAPAPHRSRAMQGAAKARSSRRTATLWLGGGGILAAAVIAAVVLLPGAPDSDSPTDSDPTPSNQALAPAGTDSDDDPGATEGQDQVENEVAADDGDPPGSTGQVETDESPPADPPAEATPPTTPPEDPEPAPTTGTLTVVGSLPPGARITGRGPDGDRRVPLRGGPLEPGPWTLVLEADGYEPLEFPLEIAAGDSVEWAPEPVAVAEPEPEAEPEPPPPADPEPDLSALRAEIAGTLSRFASAFETRSMAEVLALYPGAPEDWQAEYRTLIENTDDIRNLETEVQGLEHVATTEGRGEVTFTLTLSFDDFRNQPQSQAIPYTATLEPAGGSGWRIASLNAR